MRKVSPKELLDCLDSLLGTTGGIRGEREVRRMADLMRKFSKKLVSRCIFIQILKNTEPDLLSMFMELGGWELVYDWLSESITSGNSALIREILQLYLICPANIDHLQLNNCPKVVKALSRDSDVDEIRILGNEVVDKWLSFVKCGRAAISDVIIEEDPDAPLVLSPVAAEDSVDADPNTAIAIPLQIQIPTKFAVFSALPANIIPATSIQRVKNMSGNIPVKVSANRKVEVIDVPSDDEWEEGQIQQLEKFDGIQGFQTPQVAEFQEMPQIQKPQSFQVVQGIHGLQKFKGVNGNEMIEVVQEDEEVEMGQMEEIGAVEAVETVKRMKTHDIIKAVKTVRTVEEEEGEEAGEIEELEELEELEEEEEEELEIEEEEEQPMVKVKKIETEKKLEVIPSTGTLPLYKITVRDGKKVLAQVGTKTLTLPIPKRPEPQRASNTVASLIIKSDPITKKFQYVSSKDKSSASETIRKQFFIREKTQSKSDEKLRVAPMVLIQKLDRTSRSEERLSERAPFELVKQKSCESLLKSPKDDKVKDLHGKSSKTHKGRESHRSYSKHSGKDKKERESSKDKKRSEHKSHSSDKEKSKHRDKESSSSSSSSSKSKSKSKSKHKDKDSHKSKSRDRDEKSKSVKDSSQKESKDSKGSKSTENSHNYAVKIIPRSDEKDKLAKLKAAISAVCDSPKKSSSLTTSGAESLRAEVPEIVFPKPTSSHLTGDKVSKISGEIKKPTGLKSVDLKSSQDRPKTVKTYHSKFRSTGLEEEIKPPPARSTVKKKTEEKRPMKSTKKSSNNDDLPPEKKLRISQILADYKRQKLLEKPGAIKLIPPKPKPALLESDMFSDALTASMKIEPRKKKRRASSSKEVATEKKETLPENSSAEEVKPALKFYRDTLEDNEKSTESKRPRTGSGSEDVPQSVSSGDVSSKLYPNGVLVYKARQGPKKSVKWKEESELTKIRFFELDENERINVTRTFVDLKLLERNNEREAFQLARRLASDDNMEEMVPWGPLIVVDVPPDRVPPVEPGKNSEEKNIQYAREKTVLQAIYFHRNSIPDSPAEPDVEFHITTDPKIIPLDDITGNTDSVTSFRNIPWPEPKPALIPSSPPRSQHIQPGLAPQTQQQQLPQQSPQQQPQPLGFGTGYSTVGNFSGYPPVGIHALMTQGQNNWRGGDDKDMGMNMNYTMEGPMNMPQMNQGGLFSQHGPENYGVSGPQMGNFNASYPMNCDPNMYGPSQVNMGGPPQWNRNWQGGNNRGGGKGGSGPGSGSGSGPGSGSGSGSGGSGGGHYSSSSKYHKGVCHHFSKYGSCARGNSCRFMHPN